MGELPVNVGVEPVVGLVAEVDVVDLDLAEPAQRAGRDGELVAAEEVGVGPAGLGAAGPGGLEAAGGLLDVGPELGGRAAGARLDTGVTLGHAAGVARQVL